MGLSPFQTTKKRNKATVNIIVANSNFSRAMANFRKYKGGADKERERKRKRVDNKIYSGCRKNTLGSSTISSYNRHK